jgi:hypothetical protein
MVPPPLTGIDVLYPENLGIGLSGLGLATCSATTIEAAGAGSCPPDSRMGLGSALAAIPFGPEILEESARVAIFRAPTQNGHIALLVAASGSTPVEATIVSTGLLLPTRSPFGGHVSINFPLVPSLPGAPDVSVVNLAATLGPQHLTYFERVHGRTIAYTPKGILLPESCPRGGFRFAAALVFVDGTNSKAQTTVPCPRSRGRRHR